MARRDRKRHGIVPYCSIVVSASVMMKLVTGLGAIMILTTSRFVTRAPHLFEAVDLDVHDSSRLPVETRNCARGDESHRQKTFFPPLSIVSIVTTYKMWGS